MFYCSAGNPFPRTPFPLQVRAEQERNSLVKLERQEWAVAAPL